MFKVVLTLAIFIAAVLAQGAPTPVATCVAYTNTTGTDFCAADILYQIPSATNAVQKNTDANTAYTNIINQITGANDACRNAVRIFACQTNFNKCGKYNPITGVAQARCDTIRTACNVTAFPGTLSASGCVANNLASVDGQTIVCVPTAFTTLGGACTGSVLNPTIATPSVIQNNICPIVSSCNTTAGVCARPSNLGDACSGTGSCVTLPGSATALECLGNRCSYRNKRHGLACFVNEECRSNNCVNSACFESAVNGNCSTTLNCRDNLWCDVRNATCYDNAALNGACGIVQTNWSPVPCLFGLTCVRQNATGFSTCQSNANLGDFCSVATGANAYDSPLCDPANLPSGVAQCTNGRCSVATGALENQLCNSTITCSPQLTCSYANVNATQGTCVQPGTVACDTVGGNQCNTNQQCSCTANVAQTGTCAVAQNPTVNCAAQTAALGVCVKNTCRNAPFYPYDGVSCGATQCSAQINAYFCCVKNTVGANYVAPTGQTVDPCLFVTTLAPTGQTTANPSGTPGPTGSNVPTPTPSRSGAVNTVVSVVAIIIAVVASL